MARDYKNIVPYFLEEEVQEVNTASGSADWNMKTSRILVKDGGAGVVINLVKPEPDLSGIIVEVGKDTGNFSCIVNMDPYGPFNNDADFKTVELQYGGATTTAAAVFTCFWNGENWVPIGLTATT